MDSRHAFVIANEGFSADGEYDVVSKVKCDGHEDDNHKNDRVEQSKESAELKKYFKELANHIDEVNEIYIFGPGKSQEQFKNFLKDNQNFDQKHIELGTSDKITENQMIAQVRNHFNR